MIRLKLLFISMILVGIGASGSFAQTDSVYRLSLLQAQEFALTNNQSILNADLDVESAKKKVWETTAIGLPQASATISGSYTPKLSASIEDFSSLSSLGFWMFHADSVLGNISDDPTLGNIENPGMPEQTDPNDMKWSLNATATVSQLLFSGSYLVGLQSAKVYKGLSEMNRVKSRQDVLESIKNSYFSVLIARENQSILDSTYQNLTKTLTDIQAIGKQGFIEETDVDQMQITVTNVKTSLDLITRLADIAEKLLKIQLGLNIDAHLELTDNMGNLINSIAYEQLLLADFVIENNINYQMLQSQVKVSELLLKLNKAAYLPDLAAFYQYQKEFNENAFSFTPPHIIGASMSIPIFSSGQRNSKVVQAKIELEKAQNTMEQASNGLKLEYYSSRSSLIAARDKFASEAKNLELAKKIYNRGLIKFQNGVISSTDLTTIQNQYLTVQSNYYQVIQELVSSKNRLEKILSKNE